MAESGRRVLAESEAVSVGCPFNGVTIYGRLEEWCGLKARLGVWGCPLNGVTIYGKIWKKGAG